jgi:tRNA-modifying protein YgfZ
MSSNTQTSARASKYSATTSNTARYEEEDITMDLTADKRRDFNSNSEYQAALSGAALRSANTYGRLQISGSDHLNFLHRMTTNHFESLESGCGIEAVFTENRGRILDCCTFYHRNDQTLAVLSPPARTTIPTWLDRYIFAEAIELLDITDSTSMFELIGPQAIALVQQVTGADLAPLQTHQLIKTNEDLWLSALPWAGQMGLRAIGPTAEITQLQQQFTQAGAQILSDDLWEVLRIENGIPLHGSELNEDHNPWEAGLGRAIHMNKGCYIGQEIIARLDTYDKIKQHLVGIVFAGESVPKAGTALQSDGHNAGVITSSALSPALGPIALAYVRRSYCTPATKIQTIDGKHSGQISSLPLQRV